MLYSHPWLPDCHYVDIFVFHKGGLELSAPSETLGWGTLYKNSRFLFLDIVNWLKIDKKYLTNCKSNTVQGKFINDTLKQLGHLFQNVILFSNVVQH